MKASLVILCAMCTPALADPERADAITTQPMELAARGFELGVEHHVRPHWSVMGQVGIRGAALGDYTSTTYTGGAELRWWHRAAMTGPFVAAHASVGRTSLALSATGEDMGSSWGLEQRIDVGWRFTVRNRVALTPSFGLGEHEDLDSSGRLAMYARPAVGVGFEIGFLFRRP